MPSPYQYQLDAGVIISPTPLFVMVFCNRRKANFLKFANAKAAATGFEPETRGDLSSLSNSRALAIAATVADLNKIKILPVLVGHGVEAVTVSGFKSLRASISERSSAPGVACNTGEGSNTMSIRVARGSEGVAGVRGSYSVPCVGVWTPCVGVGKSCEGVWKPCVGVWTDFVRTETVITGNGHHFPSIINVGIGI